MHDPKSPPASTALAKQLPTVPEPSAVPASATPFAELDEIVSQPDSFGVLRVAASAADFAALGRHVARRACAAHRHAEVLAAPISDAWRELARRCDALRGGPLHPHEVARRICSAAAGAVVLVAEQRSTAWGRALGEALALASKDPDRRILLVMLRAEPQLRAHSSVDHRRDDPPETVPGAGRLGLSRDPSGAIDRAIVLERLSVVDHARWWGAVVAQDAFVSQDRLRDLDALDRWWEATRRRGAEPMAVDSGLSDAAAELAGWLLEAQQALTAEQIELLAPGAACEELLSAGVAHRDLRGALVMNGRTEVPPLTTASRRRLHEVLARSTDPWSIMRAAELALDDDSGSEQACALSFRALRSVPDALAREDLWERWERIVARASSSRQDELAQLLSGAELALELGDGERADQLARRAMAIDSARFDVLLLHGRASNARGDVTTAALSLTRAMGVAASSGERARAAGLMAHVRYTAGDPKQAERYASEAVELSEDAETRLEGRNVLGKLLLAREQWAQAEQHFASDAYEAAIASAHEAELRARLNRAIAILYLGRREKARELLEEVCRDGESSGSLRATAFALSNLAAIGILEHQYERALELSERAIEVRRAIGGRVGMVQPITNLAELRLQLGLVDEAEQALRFGLSACGQDLPLSRYAYFAKTSACIHLERGDTALASKDLATAISGATCSGELAVLAQCHRINTRIALEDGDVARASLALSQALEMRHTAFGEAELRVLAARCARAAGDDFLELAREALLCAQRADDPESKREAHVLLCRAHRLAGDETSAQSHLQSAVGERERIAASLPPALRARYVGRRALAELAALEAGALDDAALDEPESPRTVRTSSAAPLSGGLAPSRQLVGESPVMCALRGTIRRVAATEATVLIHGETGTGKELVAEAIHRASRRAAGPLVKVNCAALVETLLLSELFGHEKGAFTGASARRRGRFEIAEGGTLFLDEIGDISARTQVALLRVLQDGTFERVGGCTQLRANVRIVCATHRDLRAMVERGEFREDLYYRLCGMIIEAPPLRERIEDLGQLAQALLEQAQRTSGIESRPLSPEALRALARHGWPGNVRELENAVRVAALFARGDAIELSDFTDNVEGLRQLGSLPSGRQSHPSSVPPPPETEGREGSLPPPPSSSDIVYAEIRSGTRLADMKRRIEEECIARALVESGGNITRAASMLGMKRPRLSQLVKQYKLATVLEDIKS